jgi:maltose/moltooligosaccharide transporter
MLQILNQLKALFIVQFFTWLGLFSLWIYATPVITRYVFKALDTQSVLFEDGTIWVGICFAFYSTLAAILTFVIPRLLKKISKEKLHALALFAGGIGLLLIYFIKNKYLLLCSFAFIGIAWSSISSIPYHIVSDIGEGDKLTRYFAVFNFSIVIPQVTAAFLLGFMIKHFFSGEPVFIMLAGGCFMLLAALIMFFIKETMAPIS